MPFLSTHESKMQEKNTCEKLEDSAIFFTFSCLQQNQMVLNVMALVTRQNLRECKVTRESALEFFHGVLLKPTETVAWHDSSSTLLTFRSFYE
jgi:hypothetical protein